MSVVVVRLSSNRMQASGNIGIVGLRNCCRFRICLVAIMRRIKLVYLHILLNSFMSNLGGHDCSFSIFWGGACPLCPIPPPVPAPRVPSSGGGRGGSFPPKHSSFPPKHSSFPAKILAYYNHWSDNNLGFNTFQISMLGLRLSLGTLCWQAVWCWVVVVFEPF